MFNMFNNQFPMIPRHVNLFGIPEFLRSRKLNSTYLNFWPKIEHLISISDAVSI